MPEPPAAAAVPAPASQLQPTEPVLVFAPYLPLREPVIAGEWWIGPLKKFAGPWLNARYEDLARTFIGSFRGARGEKIENPALIAHGARGADGSWPGPDHIGRLQLALDFAVLDSNPPWSEDEVQRQGGLVATSDNSRLFVWSMDLAEGRIALIDGALVETQVFGVRITDSLVMYGPTELHLPVGVVVPGDLLDALLEVFAGKKRARDKTLDKRLAVAVTWLAQAWRNTRSIRQVDRIIMLKTGFEALTGQSQTWKAANRLEKLFGGLRKAGVTDAQASELMWSPSETKNLTWTWTMDGETWTKLCTPLSHWFGTFGNVRNELMHQGTTASLEYQGQALRYGGPYVYVAERLLRESCRVALGQFGYNQLWKSYPLRLAAKALAGVPLEAMLAQTIHSDEDPLPELPEDLEARPHYLIERRAAGGWLAWTARAGSQDWQVVRFPEWPQDRHDTISDDPMGLMRLSSVIIADAFGDARSFDDLYKDDESGRYQALWSRFLETHLLAIGKGQRGLLNPNEVLAWTSIQPESDLFDV